MKLRSILTAIVAAAALMFGAGEAQAQFNVGRLLQGIVKGVQAVTLSDDQGGGLCGRVCPLQRLGQRGAPSLQSIFTAPRAYHQRHNRCRRSATQFQSLQNEEVNAFACADGSVRVYTGLMDVMTDDEVLGVIGHEIGHVAHHDSRNAFKQALMNDAIKDGLASTSNTVATLTDSQLAQVGNALVSSKFSRKQEQNADDYGYSFLKASGHNPTSMVYAFRKLQAMEQQAGGGGSTALSQLFFPPRRR